MAPEFVTLGVAEDLLSTTSRGAWDMASALLEDIPADLPDAQVLTRSEAILEALAARGITAPNGDPYVAASLMSMRRTAIAWPVPERHLEAAYRTHQETGPPGSVGREVLKGLVAVSRGEHADRPDDIDPEAWASAVARVEKRISGKKVPRYKVTANDVRVALQRTVNIPTRARPQGGTTLHLMSEVSTASQALRAFARQFVEADPSPEERTAMSSALERLIDRAEQTLTVVNATTEITDEDLIRLLQETADD